MLYLKAAVVRSPYQTVNDHTPVSIRKVAITFDLSLAMENTVI